MKRKPIKVRRTGKESALNATLRNRPDRIKLFDEFSLQHPTMDNAEILKMVLSAERMKERK